MLRTLIVAGLVATPIILAPAVNACSALGITSNNATICQLLNTPTPPPKPKPPPTSAQLQAEL